MTGNRGPAQVITSEETFTRPRLASAGGDKCIDTTQRHRIGCFNHVFLSFTVSNPHLSSVVIVVILVSLSLQCFQQQSHPGHTYESVRRPCKSELTISG